MLRHRTIKDIEEKTSHMVGNVQCRTERHHTILIWVTRKLFICRYYPSKTMGILPMKGWANFMELHDPSLQDPISGRK